MTKAESQPVHKDHGDFITADPALGADQPLDAQRLGEGIPGLRVLSPSYTGMSSTAGRIHVFYRVKHFFAPKKLFYNQRFQNEQELEINPGVFLWMRMTIFLGAQLSQIGMETM